MTTTNPIRVFVFGTGGSRFSTSGPFPLKLCTWMRMAKIEHEVVVENESAQGAEGQVAVDRIRRDANRGLLRHHRASERTLRRRLRCSPHRGREGTRAHGLSHARGALSPGLRASAVSRARWGRAPRGVRVDDALGSALDCSPCARKAIAIAAPRARARTEHEPSEIIAQGKADLDALRVLLGDNRYFLGDRPSSIDACIFGFLGTSMYVSGDNPLFTYAASVENLKRYCERMRAEYFPETVGASPAKSNKEVAA